MNSARNDIYTTKYWQLAVNFLLGAGSLTFLILSLVTKNAALTASGIVIGIAMAIALVVFNIVLRASAPLSYLQYTAVRNGVTYRIQIISKDKAVFSDGENVIVSEGRTYYRDGEIRLPHCSFDFYKDMSADMRIAKAESETYVGTVECDGKKLKCKITFKNGVPFVGSVGGVRIKYFDINDRNDRFVVPKRLKDAVEACGVKWPKLDGVRIGETR